MTMISMQAARMIVVILALMLGALTYVRAQSDPAIAPKPSEPVIAPLSQNSAPGVAWDTLSQGQRETLAPLAAIWPKLSLAHQNKWLALVRKYPDMAEADKARLHSRMVDWAALSPKERELARLNFAETKKLSNDARVANWEAYQALPESKKQELLDAAPKKAVGAAVAIKPVPASKMAEVPVTRKTPEPVRAAAGQRMMVDRYTLLPQNSNTKDSLQAPTPAAK
jgi:hypothetical protein